MGIKDLRPFIEEKSPNIVKEISIKHLRSAKIAVDIMVFLYKYLRSAGEENWIPFMIQNLSVFAKHRVDIVCVFDGKETPKEKEEERLKRRDNIQPIFKKIQTAKDLVEKIKSEKGPIKDQEMIKNVNDILAKQQKITGYSSINFNVRSTIIWVLNETILKWEKQTLFVTEEHIKITKELCKILRIPIYQAKGEGETVCACLCLGGDVDAVYTEDTDILVYGCPMQLYGFDIKKETVKVMYLEDVLESLSFSYEQFRDFCIMLKCDYNQRVPGVGSKMSYALLSKCDFIEGIIDIDPEYFEEKRVRTACKKVQENCDVLNYERCRELFDYHRVGKVRWPSYKSISYEDMDNFLKKNNVYSKRINAKMLLSENDWQPIPMKFLEE